MEPTNVSALLLGLYQFANRVYLVEGIETAAALEKFCDDGLPQSVTWAVLELLQQAKPFLIGVYGVKGKYLAGNRTGTIMTGYMLFPEPGKEIKYRLVVNERIYVSPMKVDEIISILVFLMGETLQKNTSIHVTLRDPGGDYVKASELSIEDLSNFKLDALTKIK